MAGQAGSGKTLVMDLVHTALEQWGGAVRVDRDTYKTLHPHYNTFLTEDVLTAGVRVRPETYRWQAEVEAHARVRRFDVVAEEALADPAGWLATLAVYRAAGYRVEVVALAVPEAVSQLGVLEPVPTPRRRGPGPVCGVGQPRRLRGRAAHRPGRDRSRAPGRPGRAGGGWSVTAATSAASVSPASTTMTSVRRR
ncbi:zeta toxin family protein [Streptomyces sp. NPDC002514]|uniref:zeta toxin family protein n=1 Tax=Streptomyces sp. NPDC001270 TaxID=3364554 RepID=UPI0036890ACA